jgi:hypothetical protein
MRRTESVKLFFQQAFETHPYLLSAFVVAALLGVAL